LGDSDGWVGVGTGGAGHAHGWTAGGFVRSGVVRAARGSTRLGAGAGAATLATGSAAGASAPAAAGRPPDTGPRPMPAVDVSPAGGTAAASGYCWTSAGFPVTTEASPPSTAK
jgi:hypothetical protein